MTIDKPEIGDLEWGGPLNTVLDELANKETIDGSQTKATQAYEAAIEYADARVGEITVDVTGATAAAQAAASAASASASSAGAASTSAASAAATASDDASDAASSAAAAANSAATTAAALTGKQNISSLSTDVAAHVTDGTTLDTTIATKVATVGDARYATTAQGVKADSAVQPAALTTEANARIAADATKVAKGDLVFNVMDYGAVGNGVADDTAAFQAAIDACIGGSPAAGASAARQAKGTFYMPNPAVGYRITAPLKIYSVLGFHWAGAGTETFLYADGVGLTSVLDINGAYRSLWENFTVTALPSTFSTTTVTTAVQLDWSSLVAQRSAQGNTFRNINVRNLKCVNAFGFGVNSSNVDVSAVTVVDCQAVGSWTAGETTWYQSAFHFGNGASGNVLNHWARSIRPNAFRYGAFADSVNVFIDGIDTGYCEADVHGTGTGEITVKNGRSEHSSQLYSGVGGASYGKNVSIEDFEFVGNTQLESNGRFIAPGYAGHLFLKNVRYRQADASVLTPNIYLANGQMRFSSLTAIGLTMPVAYTAAVTSPGIATTPCRITLINYQQNNSSSQITGHMPFYSKTFGGTAGSPAEFADGILGVESTITAGTSAQYYRGDKTMQTLNADAVPDGTTNKAYTATEKTKLSGIATAATANQSDATTNAAIAAKATSQVVNAYTASTTWTKPAGLKSVTVVAIGGGYGGGSGAQGAVGTARCGGGGGGGGGYSLKVIPVGSLGATESVTVGAGGTGGAAQASTTTAGNAGTGGSASSFGSHVRTTGGTNGGGGGIGVAGSAGGGGSGLSAGGAGGASSATGLLGASGAQAASAGGGGAGGGVTTAEATSAGGGGATSFTNTFASGTGGTAGGGVGGSGTSSATGSGNTGGGGAGGGSSVAGAGGAGGNGGNYGAGGGGGGASTNGSASGAGGNGGGGIVLVIEDY